MRRRATKVVNEESNDQNIGKHGYINIPMKVVDESKDQNVGKYRYIGTWILWIYRKYRWIFLHKYL